MNSGQIVLVVDDDEDVRATMRAVLEDEGYVVDLAKNGAEALARMKTPPAPAVVLLDLRMPVMDGEALLLRIGAEDELARIPVVITTAARLPNGSCRPLLERPFSIDALLRVVASALNP